MLRVLGSSELWIAFGVLATFLSVLFTSLPAAVVMLLNCCSKKKQKGKASAKPVSVRRGAGTPSKQRSSSNSSKAKKRRKPWAEQLDTTQGATEKTVDKARTGVEPDEGSFKHCKPRDIDAKNAKQIREQGMVSEDHTGAGTTDGTNFSTNFEESLA